MRCGMVDDLAKVGKFIAARAITLGEGVGMDGGGKIRVLSFEKSFREEATENSRVLFKN